MSSNQFKVWTNKKDHGTLDNTDCDVESVVQDFLKEAEPGDKLSIQKV